MPKKILFHPFLTFFTREFPDLFAYIQDCKPREAQTTTCTAILTRISGMQSYKWALLPKQYIIFTPHIAYRLFDMNAFKSSPLIQDKIKPKFNRKSRRVSRKRQSKQQEVLIPNPFRQGEQQNYLPKDLKQQIEQMDYISPTQVQTISFGSQSGARRSSLFNRHLQAMQNAAKKQEEMYNFFMGGKAAKKESCPTDLMDQELPITIEQNDNLSTRMNHCFFILDDHMEQEQLDFLSPEVEEEDVIFYSEKMIESEEIGDDYEAYFDV